MGIVCVPSVTIRYPVKIYRSLVRKTCVRSVGRYEDNLILAHSEGTNHIGKVSVTRNDDNCVRSRMVPCMCNYVHLR
jgi:hypothetical protein